MFGSDIFGASVFGSGLSGVEMIFTPVSKNTTYLDIIDMVKLQTGAFKNPLINNTFLLKQISISIQNIARQLPKEQKEQYYLYPYSGLIISGTANPYTVDLSTINPYVEDAQIYIHVTAGGVRTHAQVMDANKAENLSSLQQYATTLLGAKIGDKLQLFAGSSFTITTSTDTLIFNFIRQTIASGVTTASYIDLSDSLIQLLVDAVVAEVVKYNK